MTTQPDASMTWCVRSSDASAPGPIATMTPSRIATSPRRTWCSGSQVTIAPPRISVCTPLSPPRRRQLARRRRAPRRERPSHPWRRRPSLRRLRRHLRHRRPARTHHRARRRTRPERRSRQRGPRRTAAEPRNHWSRCMARVQNHCVRGRSEVGRCRGSPCPRSRRAGTVRRRGCSSRRRRSRSWPSSRRSRAGRESRRGAHQRPPCSPRGRRLRRASSCPRHERPPPRLSREESPSVSRTTSRQLRARPTPIRPGRARVRRGQGEELAEAPACFVPGRYARARRPRSNPGELRSTWPVHGATAQHTAPRAPRVFVEVSSTGPTHARHAVTLATPHEGSHAPFAATVPPYRTPCAGRHRVARVVPCVALFRRLRRGRRPGVYRHQRGPTPPRTPGSPGRLAPSRPRATIRALRKAPGPGPTRRASRPSRSNG